MNGNNNYNNQQNNNTPWTMEQLLATPQVNNPQPQEQIQQPVQEPQKKKSKKGIIIAIILILLILGGVVLFFLLNKDTITKEKEKQENLNWSGIYKNGEDYVKIYQLDEDTIYFDIITEESRAYTTATIDGNTAEAKIYATYKLELNDNKLKVTSTDEYMLNATYTKKGEYSKNDIYIDNYGDPEALNTIVNGTFYYERRNGTISIYQPNKDTALFSITNGEEKFELEVNVIDNKVEHVEELADEKITITIDFTEENLKIRIKSTEKGRFFNHLGGTYIKTGSITMDSILNERLK